MVPVLDETSLVPHPTLTVGFRVLELAKTLRALDRLGASRAIRSTRDAADLDLAEGRGLRSWCFDRSVDRDAGRLVASRLGKQPFLDGPDGLFASQEGSHAIEALVAGALALGAGYVALTDGLLVLLQGVHRPEGSPVTVLLGVLTDDELFEEQREIMAVASEEEVDAQREGVTEKVTRSVPDGPTLVRRLPELFPRLRLGGGGEAQLLALTGNEPIFGQVLRHLRALQDAAEDWEPGSAIAPAVAHSVESKATLEHGMYGSLRDFPTPEGVPPFRWTLHTKLAGGVRLYYHPHEQEDGLWLLIGYLGPHLPTVRFPD